LCLREPFRPVFPRQNASAHWQIVSIGRACPEAAECDLIRGCSSMLSQNGRSPKPEQRRSACDRPNFVKHSGSEPALSTHDECPVSRQAQPGKIESDQAVALQCAANFGLKSAGVCSDRVIDTVIAPSSTARKAKHGPPRRADSRSSQITRRVVLYQPPYPATSFAHGRLVMDAMRSGICISLFQASLHASRISS
jgi:hypothetical protein